MKNDASNTACTKFRAADAAYIAIFTALITVCSWISIPIGAVPFTMQTFAVFAAAGMLGLKRGLISILLYIVLGGIGIPVFAGFSGGAGVLFGATGGYIIGFIFTMLVSGLMIKKFGHGVWSLILAFAAGLIVCYAFGTVWFILVYAKNAGAIGLWSALSMCVVPYLLPDAGKLALAMLITRRVGKYIKL